MARDDYTWCSRAFWFLIGVFLGLVEIVLKALPIGEGFSMAVDWASSSARGLSHCSVGSDCDHAAMPPGKAACDYTACR